MLSVVYAESWLNHTGPYVIFAILGIVLFQRHRTAATALVALGFIAVIVGQLSGSFVSPSLAKTYNAHGEVTAIVGTFHGLAWTLSRYAGTVGMWVAAIGAAWHTLSHRRH